MSRTQLFHKKSLRDFLSEQERSIYAEIDSLAQQDLYNMPAEILAKNAIEVHEVRIPILGDPVVEHQETQVDVRNDPDLYHLRERSSPVLAPGSRITLTIPFEGDPQFFMMNSGAFNTGGLYGEVTDAELQTSFEARRLVPERLKAEIEAFQREANWYLNNMHSVTREWREELPSKVKKRIEERKGRLKYDEGVLASLGIPVRSRGAQATTFAPAVRKKISPVPTSKTGQLVPEHSLDMVVYEEILAVIQRMGELLDRNPTSFSALDEETLRTHILIQLNGSFESPASAETFNSHGKTDILLRWHSGNAFIAECKLWGGEKSLQAAIDQLLGYVTWRDTKTAIIVFSHRKGFTEVLGKVQSAAQGHPRFKRQITYDAANGFRAIFDHPDDPSREVTITIITFDVPNQPAAP